MKSTESKEKKDLRELSEEELQDVTGGGILARLGAGFSVKVVKVGEIEGDGYTCPDGSWAPSKGYC